MPKLVNFDNRVEIDGVPYAKNELKAVSGEGDNVTVKWNHSTDNSDKSPMTDWFNVPYFDWKDSGDTPYASKDDFLNEANTFFFRNVGTEPVDFQGEYTDYDDLVNSNPPGSPGRFAYVLNSQGTKWLPGSLGGSFYGAGWYYDTGTVWSNKNDEIFEGLELSTDQVVNITSNYTIPSSASYGTNTLRLSNRSGQDWSVSITGGDTLEGGSSAIIYDGETFDLKKEGTDWRL